MPEAGIEQMQHGVLDSADIQVDGHPVVFGFLAPGFFVIMWIAKAQVVPARTGPLRHGVGLASALFAGFGIDDLDPLSDFGQRALAIAGGFISRSTSGGHERQVRRAQNAFRAIFKMQDREGLAPIALARKEPVAQLIGDGRFPMPFFSSQSMIAFLASATSVRRVKISDWTIDALPSPIQQFSPSATTLRTRLSHPFGTNSG